MIRKMILLLFISLVAHANELGFEMVENQRLFFLEKKVLEPSFLGNIEEKYSLIYDLMSPEFKRYYPLSAFEKTLKDIEWKPQSIFIYGIRHYKKVAYASMKFEVLISGRLTEINTTLFFDIDENERWYIRNFPFASSHILEFGNIPRFFTEGMDAP